MTNKPMLSVERELLERFVSDVEAHNYGFDGLDEMRALLDKPEEQLQCHPVNRLSYSQGDRRYVNGWNDACSHWEEQDSKPQGEVERLRRLVESKEAERQQCIEECSAEVGALRAQLSEQPAPVAESTTSDKYKAELYDEVWQKARDMGFANVTDALDKPAAQQHGDPVAIVTGSAVQWLPGAGKLKDRTALYAEQPAPVALVMPERLNTYGGYSLEAENWYNLALDDVARLSGVKP